MLEKKISILISNYNKGKYINECLKSCFLQNYSNIEVIVFDNFSTDTSLNIIKKFNKIHLIKKKKISIYPAVNQLDLIISAFKKSKGEIIFLLVFMDSGPATNDLLELSHGAHGPVQNDQATGLCIYACRKKAACRDHYRIGSFWINEVAQFLLTFAIEIGRAHV